MPVPLTTNLQNAATLDLVTKVGLGSGNVHLELANVAGSFAVWRYDSRYGRWVKFLDSDSSPTIDYSLQRWRKLIVRSGSGTEAMPVAVTSSATGHVDVVFRYWGVFDGKFIEDESTRRLTSVPPPLLADADYDGAFGDGDVAAALAGRPFRFWTNEDVHKGDYVGQIADLTPNAADLVVNGRLDLVNLFPVKLDLKPFIDAWGSAATFTLWTPSSGLLRFCGLDEQTSAAWAFQTNDVYTTTGDPVSAADLTPVGGEGVEIEPDDYLGNDSAPGVLAFEAAQPISAYDSLELLVNIGDVTVFRCRLPMSISSVRTMYRWRNIRAACGDNGGEGDSSGEPWNNPDGECDGRHFVFVHGYNVNPAAARQWADAMFKRLWLSGSRSMFTAVDWCGDSSQFATLMHGDVSPDYYANVMHAFNSAPSLVSVVNALPGTNKVMLAHSLGNMLVSSAAVDHHLEYSRYYMLNAAVPMEAYDETEFTQNMIDSAWNGVPLNYRASDWNKLFQASSNDFRVSLSWRGRFSGIANAINCYSTTEDVLENATELNYGEAWSKQELFKGTTVWHGLNAIPFLGLDVACEAGWGINAYYAANPMYYVPVAGFHSSVSNLTRDAVIEHPLFTPFRAETVAMHSTNLFVISDVNYRASLRAKFLGDAIPATSFATGANPVSTNAVSENINYENCKSGDWPRRNKRWEHSDIKNVSLFFNWKFFQRIIYYHGENSNEQHQNLE